MLLRCAVFRASVFGRLPFVFRENVIARAVRLLVGLSEIDVGKLVVTGAFFVFLLLLFAEEHESEKEECA